MKRHYIAVLSIAIVLVAIFFTGSNDVLRMFSFVGIFAIALTGYVLFSGYLGQLSLAPFLFLAIGAYTTAILTNTAGVAPNYVTYKLPPLVGIAAGIVLSVVVAYVVGKIVLRLTSWHFILATVALGFIVDTILVSWHTFTGGVRGIIGIPSLSIGGLSIASLRANYVLIWVIMLALFLLALHIINSRVGRAYRAIQRDEESAAALGVDVANYKVHGFVLSAVYGAIAGGLYAHFMNFIAPSAVGLTASFQAVIAMVLGGMTPLYGVFLGSLLVKFFPEIFAFAGDYKLLIFGLVVILVVMYFPKGLAGVIPTIGLRVSRLRQRKKQRIGVRGDSGGGEVGTPGN